MSLLAKPLAFVKAHPVPVALGAVVIVGGLYVLTRGGGGGAAGAQASANATAVSAYYAAESQQGQANDAVQIASIEAQSGTTQTLLNDQTSVANNTTWANADTSQTASTNATALAIAPYQTQNNLYSDLTQVASLPPTTSTSTNNNSGFFGIGASSSTSTSVVPNANASNAANELDQLIGSYLPTH